MRSAIPKALLVASGFWVAAIVVAVAEDDAESSPSITSTAGVEDAIGVEIPIRHHLQFLIKRLVEARVEHQQPAARVDHVGAAVAVRPSGAAE